MPVSFLDMQRRAQRIGRIRIGQQVKASNGKMRPATLTTFRFTTGSQVTAEAVAAFYGGQARPWEGQRGQWEVITGRSEIWVNIPPADEVVSGWYEMWASSGVKRRCDSVREQISGGPCLCPHASDPDDADEVRDKAILRDQLAKEGKACARHLRINVQIPDLPGVGVFMLDTGSYNAATEVIGKAEMLEEARKRGIFLKAMLRIEWRQRGSDRKPYPVPVLEIMDTVRDIVSGELAKGGLRAQLPPVPGAPLRAIAGGVAPLPAPPEAPAGADDDANVVDAVIVSDWLDTALAAAMTFTSEAEGRKLWRDAAEKAHAGEIAPADARSIQELITARLADLREAPAPGALLDDGDPWAVKVEGIVSEQDAADVLAELDERVTAGSVNQDHAGRVRAAVLARFPGAAA